MMAATAGPLSSSQAPLLSVLPPFQGSLEGHIQDLFRDEVIPWQAFSRLIEPLRVDGDGITPKPQNDIKVNSSVVPTAFPDYNPSYSLGDIPAQICDNVPPRPNDTKQSSRHLFEMVTHENLHPLLFCLEPPPNPFASSSHWQVPLLCDLTGVIQTGNDNKELRFFDFLPRYIANPTPAFLLELWFRLDSRLTTEDIVARLLWPFGVIPDKKKATASFWNTRARLRKRLNVVNWFSEGYQPTKKQVDDVGDLTREQILLNTSMRIDWTRMVAGRPSVRLLKPILKNTPILDWVDSGLPVNYFIRPYSYEELANVPGIHLMTTIKSRQRLQFISWCKTGSTTADNWKAAQCQDLLPSWFIGGPGLEAAGKTFDEVDGLTHLQWLNNSRTQHYAQHQAREIIQTDAEQFDPGMPTGFEGAKEYPRDRASNTAPITYGYDQGSTNALPIDPALNIPAESAGYETDWSYAYPDPTI